MNTYKSFNIRSLRTLVCCGVLLVSAGAYADYSTDSLVRKIDELNRDIREIDNQEYASYQRAMDAINRGGLNSRYKSDAQKANDDFKIILRDYKPENMPWRSFDPFKYHNVNLNKYSDLVEFEKFVNKIVESLENIADQMKKLAANLESQASSSSSNEVRVYRQYYYPVQYERYYYPSSPIYYYNTPYYYHGFHHHSGGGFFGINFHIK